MQNAEYQEMPCISSHWLKTMLDSPAECYRQHLDPQRPVQESTKAMQFGTLVHCLALTPNLLDHEFLIADYERRSNAGKAHYSDLTATGRIVIKPAELEKARAMIEAMQANTDARNLIKGGKKERTIIQPRPNHLLPLKARLDIHHEKQRLVMELKTSYDIQRIKQTMERYRYPLSAAFYADITKSLHVQFIFVQTREPFDVAVFEMSRLQLQDGREQWQSALHRFDECWLKNEWPEAEPVAPDLEDDPLMMNFMPTTPNANGQRYDLPVGELAL